LSFISNCKWVFIHWQYHYNNKTHKYTCNTIHISHKITPLKEQTNKTKNNQISSQSYANSEGHIAANEYSIEKEKK
jgi:hypothetical protein